ncbi:helix-turn-helix domain-containing protein [Anaerococcus hydrogenalis]|uniref:helix-turn-helix domain-containing protein n=1 Tax=Anaerococcus hydrogenalis TaxID=33029 RepID=UPI001DCABDC4|nr:XRE family transcriptional regulator [Anaerococcus hydrogenalis]MBS5989678.1 helix-turn-helix domain-containing protein [Anaerococcus hydrogenalis]
MKLGDKLKAIRTENNMSMEELKNILNYKYDLNISKSMISRWENHKSEPLNTYLSAYAREFNLDMNDLLDIEDKNDLSNIPGIKIIKKFVTVPLLGEIACGEPIFCNQNYDNLFQIDEDLAKPDFSLTAKGDSMMDVGINDGDIVFFKNTSVVENGKIAAVIIDNTTTLKRFFKNDHEIILQPENKSYSPIIIREDDGQDVRVLGEMVGMYHIGSR